MSARTSICDCNHAKSHHPKQAGGRCREWKDGWRRQEPCGCTKTQQEVFDAAEAKRKVYRAERAAARARDLAYREAAVIRASGVMQPGDVRIATETWLRIQKNPDGSGAWVSAEVWVPASEIEIGTNSERARCNHEREQTR